MRFLDHMSSILRHRLNKTIYILLFLPVLFPILRSVLLAGFGPQKNQKTLILKVGTSDRVKSANIFLDSSMSVFAQLSNPPLMKMSPDGQIVGQLVRDIDVSSDYKRWEFRLEDNLYWSDGKPVTAKDVKFNFEYMQNKNPVARWMKDTIDTVTISGNNTVILQLKRPYTRLDIEMATHRLLPQHIWQSIDTPMEHTNPGRIVGCGPFVIEKTDLNSGVILFVKNPYWQGPKPKIDAIEIQIYQNIDVLCLALEKGEVDVFYNYASSYPYANLKKIRTDSRFDIIEDQSTALVFLGCNLKKKPLSDIQFREALSYAIDYGEVIKLDTLGYGKIPSRGFIPPRMNNFKVTPTLQHVIQKAKRLLEDAGYRDSDGDGLREDRNGKNLALSLLIRPTHARIAELIKDYFHSVGVNTTVKSVDASTWISLKDRYLYDLIIARTTPWGMIMHAGWATGYFDSRRTGEGVLHNIDDPDFLKICDDLLSTRNPEKLRACAFRVQDYFDRNLPAIPLYWNVFVTPFHSKFQGWQSNPLYGIFNIDNFIRIEPSPK
jgi:peptide/nickel transport system substrate-binding protein